MGQRCFNHLNSVLQSKTDRGYSSATNLLVFLYWIGTGCCYRVVSVSFEIPRSSIRNIIHRMLFVVCSLSKQVIRLPRTEAEIKGIGQAFAAKVGCQRMKVFVGSIDGTHIKIKVPHNQNKEYNSRKMCTTMILQGIVDNRGKFSNFYTGWPGSVNDSRVFKNTPVYTGKLYPPKGYFLLGDRGYPCTDEIGVNNAI